MAGRGRAADNVFVERLWRTVKYEDVYLRGYESVPDLERGLRAYFAFYNGERLHQSLGYRTPAEVYGGGGGRAGEEERKIAGFWSSVWGPPHGGHRRLVCGKTAPGFDAPAPSGGGPAR